MPYYLIREMDFVNINTIADRLTRHPLMQDIPLETIIDYTIDFIRIVGTPPSFMEKVETVEIKNHKGLLPCDYYLILHLKCSRKIFDATNNAFFTDNSVKGGLRYKIQNGVIITSIENGEIEISYRAMPMDKEGNPLIPDNGTYIRALELYIKLQWFTTLFDMGKIQPAVLQNTQQQYAWAVGQAQTDLIRPTMDQMQLITRMWNRLLDNEPRWDLHTNSKGDVEKECATCKTPKVEIDYVGTKGTVPAVPDTNIYDNDLVHFTEINSDNN